MAGSLEEVERRLSARGYRVARTREGTQEDLLEVAVPEREGPEGIFREVGASGAQVRKLAGRRRTLEEVFVAAVGGG